MGTHCGLACEPDAKYVPVHRTSATIAGTGYSHILYGRGRLGCRRRRTNRAPIWPTAWTITKTAVSVLIRSARFCVEAIAMIAPITISETWGKRRVGWRLPNHLRKTRSWAALYGTREPPSRPQKTDAKPVTMI